jgi:hypothetical protein
MAHALDNVADAAILRAHSDIVFLFAGAGAMRAKLEQTVRARKLANVRLIPSPRRCPGCGAFMISR